METEGNEMTKGSWKGSGLGEVMQNNSLPLTLIGVGIAWLVANNTGLVDHVVNDERVQAAQRRIGELAGDIGIGGGSNAPAGGQILGPDGEPLARSDSGRGNGWVHQAAGAARGGTNTLRSARRRRGSISATERRAPVVKRPFSMACAGRSGP